MFRYIRGIVYVGACPSELFMDVSTIMDPAVDTKSEGKHTSTSVRCSDADIEVEYMYAQHGRSKD